MLSMKVIAIATSFQLYLPAADATACTGSCALNDLTNLLQVKQDVQPGLKRSDALTLLQAQQAEIPAMPMGLPKMTPEMPAMIQAQQAEIPAMPMGLPQMAPEMPAMIPPTPTDNMRMGFPQMAPEMPAMIPPKLADDKEKVPAEKFVEAMPAGTALSSAGATAEFYAYPGVGYNAGVAQQIYHHPASGGGYGGSYGGAYPAGYTGGYGNGYAGYIPYGGYPGYPTVPASYAALPYNSVPPTYGGYGQTMYPTYASPYSAPIYNSGYPRGGYPYQSGSYGTPWATHTWFTEEGAKPIEVNIPRTSQP